MVVVVCAEAMPAASSNTSTAGIPIIQRCARSKQRNPESERGTLMILAKRLPPAEPAILRNRPSMLAALIAQVNFNSRRQEKSLASSSRHEPRFQATMIVDSRYLFHENFQRPLHRYHAQSPFRSCGYTLICPDIGHSDPHLARVTKTRLCASGNQRPENALWSKRSRGHFHCGLGGRRGGNRTHNPRLRRPVLYPVELLARNIIVA